MRAPYCDWTVTRRTSRLRIPPPDSSCLLCYRLGCSTRSACHRDSRLGTFAVKFDQTNNSKNEIVRRTGVYGFRPCNYIFLCVEAAPGALAMISDNCAEGLLRWYEGVLAAEPNIAQRHDSLEDSYLGNDTHIPNVTGIHGQKYHIKKMKMKEFMSEYRCGLAGDTACICQQPCP